MDNKDDWNDWKKFVLAKLDELAKDFRGQQKSRNERYDDLVEMIHQIHIDINTLKIKASIWGIIGGTIPPVVGTFIYFLSR